MNYLLKLLFSLLITLNCSTATGQITYTYPNQPFNVMFDGELVEADYWDTIPKILSAGIGFCDIVAINAPATRPKLRATSRRSMAHRHYLWCK